MTKTGQFGDPHFPDQVFTLEFSVPETTHILEDFNFDTFLNNTGIETWNLPQAPETDHTISEDLAGGKQARKDRDLKLLLKDAYVRDTHIEASGHRQPSAKKPDEIRFEPGRGCSFENMGGDIVFQKLVANVPYTTTPLTVQDNMYLQAGQDTLNSAPQTPSAQVLASRQRRLSPTIRQVSTRDRQ
jgi:hypothetical protein